LQLVAFDALYLERLQRGDPHTQRQFVAYFSELIQLKLRSRVSAPEAIEDVRQETFLRVLALVRAPDGIRQPERLGALVNSVCNNVLLEYYRSKSRVHAQLEDAPESAVTADEISGLDLLRAREAERVVRTILAELPERDRRLLKAVLLEERDKDEVCAEFGLTRDYLRVLLHRAKNTFKSLYRKHVGESSP
jgi:RNA polymerase sigma-70 factor (ECF subfamily)